MTIKEMNEMATMKANGSITPEFYSAVMNGIDNWVPACGGNEVWTLAQNGRSYLYVYNPATREHGWLDDSDIVNPENPYGLG